VARRFNEKFLYRWDRIIDFLKLHYVLSERRDTAYWRDNCDLSTIPESLSEKLDVWRHQSPWHRDAVHVDDMFPSASFQYVLYGMGFVTQQNPLGTRTDREAAKVAMKLFEENGKTAQRLVGILPSNRELIDKINTFGFQKI
jgi:tryptophan halogenase